MDHWIKAETELREELASQTRRGGNPAGPGSPSAPREQNAPRSLRQRQGETAVV